MANESPYARWNRVVSHIRRFNAAAWFLTINLPIVLVLSLYFAWSNSVAGDVTPQKYFLRVIISLIAFLIGFAIFFAKVITPAVKKADDAEDEV